MRTLFREPTEFLSLKEFRKKLKKRQLKANTSRGTWSPWKEFKLSEIVCSTSLGNDTPSIGYFCPRQDWDEPDELPSAPDFCSTAFPRIHSDALSFHACNPEELEFNRDFGVWQAPARSIEIVPTLLFVPCSAADLLGRRLGRGGGFYDRYLQSNPGIKSIGVLHSDYLFETLPEDYFHSGDQIIESILTENNFHFDLKEQL